MQINMYMYIHAHGLGTVTCTLYMYTLHSVYTCTMYVYTYTKNTIHKVGSNIPAIPVHVHVHGTPQIDHDV